MKNGICPTSKQPHWVQSVRRFYASLQPNYENPKKDRDQRRIVSNVEYQSSIDFAPKHRVAEEQRWSSFKGWCHLPWLSDVEIRMALLMGDGVPFGLKYGFCNKSFRKDETLTSWTLWKHICPHFRAWLLSVQLVGVSSFRNDLLQNPHFNRSHTFGEIKGISANADPH